MKLYAPKYYENFVCIADKCKHSCCIGWEIDVDENALSKYTKLCGGYGDVVKNSISNTPSPHFNLCENDRCPHLNEKGLCNIILNLGEDCLCDICREHPRFYNYTNYGKEVGIGISCEEAARIVLTSDCYSQIIEIGKADGQPEQTDFDAVLMREEIFAILSNTTLPYSEKLALIHEKYNVNTNINTDAEWQRILSNLEYLDENHRSLFSSYSSNMRTPPEIEKYAERLLAYFIFRHTSEAYDIKDFCISLGFCMFCERLFVSVCKAENATALDQIIEIARIISEEIEYSEDNTEKTKNEFYKFF
ncbi:MAG: flagellin lysine-N-methylase [Clostridia bacterium]|nr:flagellin lysine-N-methylase [Clostridia bacterium]